MKKVILIVMISLLFGSGFSDFQKKFIVHNSYTIDPYNNNRVTSEAQGYTLYLCVKYNKKELFDSVWKWTKSNLQRKDNLFSWVYNNDKILDKNNAADGDFFIAYSLLLAYEKWGNENYFMEFNKILKSLTQMFLPIVWKDELDVLLFPAKNGFLKNNILTLFPSYYVPFILKKFIIYNPLYKKAYEYAFSVFNTTNLTTHIYYDLIKKEFIRGNYMDLDVYRVIWYSYLDNKDLIFLKDTFSMANQFFEKKGFIPLKLYMSGENEGKSPYCVYKWFYLLYGNQKYLQMYQNLKKIDKKNYFCEALELMKGKE